MLTLIGWVYHRIFNINVTGKNPWHRICESNGRWLSGIIVLRVQRILYLAQFVSLVIPSKSRLIILLRYLFYIFNRHLSFILALHIIFRVSFPTKFVNQHACSQYYQTKHQPQNNNKIRIITLLFILLFGLLFIKQRFLGLACEIHLTRHLTII